MRKLTFFFLICASLVMSGCIEKSNIAPIQAVNELDINKFMGTWYEMANSRNSSKTPRAGFTVTFSMNEKGLITVLLKYHEMILYGPFKESTGKGKWLGPKHPGIIKISFFLNSYGDYHILDIDKDYTQALIFKQNSRNFRILSRVPALSVEDIKYLKEKIRSIGYNPDDLVWIEH